MIKNTKIFRRIGAFIFTLISVLSIFFICITYLSNTHFHEATTQLVNKDVASHIAKFTSPFEGTEINKRKADSVFYHAMVVSPNSEVYFLDTTGKVIYYYAEESLIKNWNISLDNIKKFIRSGGKDYIKGQDPKDPPTRKIFSAAEVKNANTSLGYIYVIFGGNESKNVTEILVKNHIIRLSVQAFLLIIVVSFLLTLFYFKRLQRNFDLVINTLDLFKQGDHKVRFNIKSSNELDRIMTAFNDLADKLAFNIARLNQSESERKDFITNISHDLRTPLAIAKGYTETLLLQGNLSKESTEYLQLIEIKIKQVENLVTQLFELSKIESIEFKPEKEPFVVAEILKEIADNWQLPARKKQIQITCLGCQNSSLIFADIRMMERVIQNLLDNAVKYTPESGYITLELIQNNNYLELIISNNGLPIPHDVIEYIIHHGSRTGIIKRPLRSGLGLTIVRKILDLHDFPLKISATEKNSVSFIMKIYDQIK